jgi:curved DNA-binding protein CbpA
MTDPYAILEVPADADDATIRRRYLELVKQFSPEHHPEKFASIRKAYESVRDLETRLRYRLFEAGRDDSIDAILEDLACRTTRRRLSLQELVLQEPTLQEPTLQEPMLQEPMHLEQTKSAPKS